MRVFNPHLISFSDSVMLLRHGTDLPVLRSDLNPPLDPAKLYEFKELVSDIVDLCHSKKQIRLLHSNRKRAQESVEIIVDAIGTEHIVEIIETGLIREVYHGHFKIINHKQGDIYPPLVDAWTLWAEALADSDIDYRYGDSFQRGKLKGSSLVDIFTKFGENHREFTLRIYSFLMDLINLHYSDNNIFNIVLAHQATLSRIQRVFNALTVLEKVPSEGALVREIERVSDRINIEESRGVVIQYPPKDFAISVLQQEVNYLKI